MLKIQTQLTSAAVTPQYLLQTTYFHFLILNNRISAVNSYSAWWKWNLIFSFFPPLFSDTVIHFSVCSFRAWSSVTEVNRRFSIPIVWEQEQAITRAHNLLATFSYFLFVPAPSIKVIAEHFLFFPCAIYRNHFLYRNFTPHSVISGVDCSDLHISSLPGYRSVI